MRTALYRHFGKDNVLLYVGISIAVASRLSQHRKHSKWFDELTRVDIEWYASRPEALKAERTAIQNENPIFNKQWNRNNLPSTPLDARIPPDRQIVEPVAPPPTIGPFAHDVPSAARLIGIGPSFCWQLIRKGKIRAVRIGHRTLIPTVEIARVASGGC